MMQNRKRITVSTGTPWEERVGYSRAVRVGDRIFVTGTVAVGADGRPHPGDAYAQARRALEIIGDALAQAGASLADVVRTRIYVTDVERDWQGVGRAHAEVFGDVRPATTMVEVSKLIAPEYVVEIEVDAIAGSGPPTGT